MASMLRRRINNELTDRAVRTRVRIVILTGHGGGKSHGARAVGRDQFGTLPAGLVQSSKSHDPVISVNETDASINSASSQPATGWPRTVAAAWAMLAASAGQAWRTESAIGSPEAELTGVMLSGLYPSSRGSQ